MVSTGAIMCRRVSLEFTRYRELRTDDIHPRETSGREPEVLKVALRTGAAYSGTPLDQSTPAPLSLHPLVT